FGRSGFSRPARLVAKRLLVGNCALPSAIASNGVLLRTANMKTSFAQSSLIVFFLAVIGTLTCRATSDARAYGATPAMKKTDDTRALNAAIASLRKSYKLYFPCGTYLVSS